MARAGVFIIRPTRTLISQLANVAGFWPWPAEASRTIINGELLTNYVLFRQLTGLSPRTITTRSQGRARVQTRALTCEDIANADVAPPTVHDVQRESDATITPESRAAPEVSARELSHQRYTVYFSGLMSIADTSFPRACPAVQQTPA